MSLQDLRILLAAGAASLLISAVPGCGDGGPFEQCETSSAGGCTFQACCTLTQCRYIDDNGNVFPCDGLDCTAAANDLAAQCVATTNADAAAVVDEALVTIEGLSQ
jgi:hypothetical protein